MPDRVAAPRPPDRAAPVDGRRPAPASAATGAAAPDDDLLPLRDALSAWYRRGHRDLPWRRTSDPYAIWVSEIMLQQTRVETVAPRFERWLSRFPTVSALAAAPLDDVLAEWSGLGYYARARNLHLAAREVATRYGGALPDDPAAIRALPGVGRYTAGAISSIAFRRREPILDGNVIRVLTRLGRLDGDPRAPALTERLWRRAGELVSGGDPSVVNQALMELGATVCTPRRPACLVCPVAAWCGARRAGDAEAYPSPTRATRVVALTHVAVALLRRGDLLMLRRPASGLWGGLYELPTDEPHAGEPLRDAAIRVAGERAGISIAPPAGAAPLVTFEHVLTHRRITFHLFCAAAPRGRARPSGYDAPRWLPPEAAAALGVSRATRRLLAALASPRPAPPTKEPR